MNRFHIVSLFVGAILLSLVSACASAGRPLQQTSSPAVGAAGPVKAGATAEWDKTLAESRKEGKVIVYSTSGPEVRIPVGQAFKDKYGIPVEFRVGGPAEIAARISLERKAGLHVIDIYIGGPNPLYNSFKLPGLLELLDPVLVLSEVTNPQSWQGKKLGFIDNDHRILYFIAAPMVSITLNSDLVKPGDIASWNDILNPKWKGRIAYADPTVPSAAHKDFAVWIQPGRLGVEYFRQLAKQDLFISRDDRPLVEGTARGKFAIALSVKTDMVGEFIKAGAPLTQIIPNEGTYVQHAAGALGLITDAPNPNAAKLFINWLLTKEGQTVFSKGYGYPSARVDVPTDHVDPKRLLSPSVNYIWSDTEEFLQRQPEALDIAKDVFSAYIK